MLAQKFTLSILVCTLGIVELAHAQADPSSGGTKVPIVRTIENFGAIADDGIDDSEAFNLAVDFFSNVGAANVNYATHYGILKFGAGTYLIGNQTDTLNPASNAFRLPVYRRPFQNINGLIIQGTVFECGGEAILLSKIKIKDSTSYGYFDVTNMSNPVPASGPPTATTIKSAQAPFVFRFNSTAQNVIVKDLELNGNSNNYKMGGTYSPESRSYETGSYGILSYSGKYISLNNLFIYDFGTDGICISHSDQFTGIRWNVTIDSIRSYWNGRQALTWANGEGLKMENSDIAYTGYKVGHYDTDSLYVPGLTAQPPGANLDIEPLTGQVVKHGLFKNSNIRGQAWDASINIANETDSLQFEECNIYGSLVSNPGSDAGKRSISLNSNTNHKSIKFLSCDIKGMIIDQNNMSTSSDRLTTFRNCNISQTNTNFGMTSWALITHQGKMLFANCNFNKINKRNFILGKNPVGYTKHDIIHPDVYTVFDNCNFISTFDHVQTPWSTTVADRLYLSRFTGNNKFTHTVSTVPSSSHQYLSHCFTVNGSDISSAPSTFVFSDLDYFTAWVNSSVSTYMTGDSNVYVRPTIFGETPCEHLDVEIGSGTLGKSAFNNNTNPLYIGENTTLRVKKGNLLILNGPVYLAGKIVVDSGAYINIRYVSSTTHTTFYYLSGTTLNNHLILHPGAHVNTTNGFVYIAPPYGYDTVIVPNRSDLMAPDSFLRAGIDRFYYNSSVPCDTTAGKPTISENKSLGEGFEAELFPNPTSKNITLKLMNRVGLAVVKVYNGQGQLVLTRNMEEDMITIATDNLPSGVYLVTIENNGYSITKKISKIN